MIGLPERGLASPRAGLLEGTIYKLELGRGLSVVAYFGPTTVTCTG